MDEHRLRRLIDVGRSMVAELDLDALLERLLEVAREVTGARYAALGILDDRRERLERFLTVGIDAETQASIGDLPRGHGVLGVLIEDPRPLRLSDVGAHPRSYGFPLGHPPMRSFLGVPILIDGEAWGNLYLTEKQGGPFDDQDEEAVVVLADWAAVAVETRATTARCARAATSWSAPCAGWRRRRDRPRARRRDRPRTDPRADRQARPGARERPWHVILRSAREATWW